MINVAPRQDEHQSTAPRQDQRSTAPRQDQRRSHHHMALAGAISHGSTDRMAITAAASPGNTGLTDAAVASHRRGVVTTSPRTSPDNGHRHAPAFHAPGTRACFHATPSWQQALATLPAPLASASDVGRPDTPSPTVRARTSGSTPGPTLPIGSGKASRSAHGTARRT